MSGKNSNKNTSDDFQFREFYDVAHNWLKMLGNSVDKHFIKHELSSHPEYPALISLIDLLDSGQLDYSAVKATRENLNEFNYPVIAHLQSSSNTQGVIIVENIDEWRSNDNVLKNWTGITIFSNNKSSWKNEENIEAVKKRKQSLLISTTYATIFFASILYCLLIRRSIQETIWYCLSTIGLFISLLTIVNELGIKNSMVKKVCGTISAGGCDKILRSRYAAGFLGISVADFAFAYFSAQMVCLFLIAFSPHNFFLYDAQKFSALFGILIAGLSIYTQRAILKQWCALCLGIIGILTAQFVFSAFFLSATTAFSLLGFMASICLVLLFEIPIKRLWEQVTRLKPQIQELKRWKNNSEIFMSLLYGQRSVDFAQWNDEIQLGNPSAPFQITVACNPYCKPCASAHRMLDEVLDRNHDRVGVSIRFTCSANNIQDRKTEAVNLIMNKIKGCTPSETKEVLTDWFNLMDKDKWLLKWPISDIERLTYNLEQHENWIKNAGITSTPTIFINGYRLPGQYESKDLLKIVPSLVEKQERYN